MAAAEYPPLVQVREKLRVKWYRCSLEPARLRQLMQRILQSPPPTPNWDSMLSMEGRIYKEAPLLAFWPGLCLASVVYGINMFGDALRDLLDPRLRGAGRFAAGSKPTGKAASE